MPLSGFHPAVASWFADTIGEPTPAQERGWKAIRQRRNTLIAAPTGSGKTFAAFLNALDQLFREGVEHGLADEVRVVYVSPLKALSTDIHKNLVEPRQGIAETAQGLGLEPVEITAAVRTGDTTASARAAMLKRPPHIVVTTPESLYLLLTAERSREMLRTVQTVIVDEIHAVVQSRRGSHLALSLERLEHITTGPLQRIGLSATQHPIEQVAQFLVGVGPDGIGRECAVVDEGHRRAIDLALELPGSPLEAVMSHEVWEEVFDRLAQLIEEHRVTLVFVNTRRLAERVARDLEKRVGQNAVTAHHGSLAKEARLEAEQRLKEGRLKALVATASLELGIDIGYVDLVCQLGSPHWISTLLQRVGRSGHTIHGTPKGRLFPLTRDDLAECAALMRSVGDGELDRIVMLEQPRDVLAQQVVAEAAAEDWNEAELYDLFRRAYPYRALEREDFSNVVRMVAEGFTTRRGRRGALVHYDGVNKQIKGRRGARMLAITSGGAIPDNADYRVVLEPEGTFIGTLNEDFAIESMAGDIFQLGNTSWRILQIGSGTVRVADAKGEPPNIPFWFGEAPARSAELSQAVARLRADIDRHLDDPDRALAWLEETLGLSRSAATQLVHYLADAKRVLGVLPTQETLVLERFFDESGGMQLVLHAPFGSRVNRAWGLALRKKFCRSFNFELQAAATEEGLLLSLGPQHSFPLDDVFRYLHPNTLRDTLIQALLDAPMFQTRWRWNTTISLAVLRRRGGRRTPAPLQRMESDDLMAAAFPDAAACLENIAGDREIPDHPLVRQTVDDCLTEAMDLPELVPIIERIFAGDIACVSRDTPEPSALCHEILNARPYAFLDDAPLEERRTQAVYTRRATEPSSAKDLGALDPEAIARVRDEAWPEPRDPDELHDALMQCGFVSAAEGETSRKESWAPLFHELAAAGRATEVTTGGENNEPGLTWWVATERVPEFEAIHSVCLDPPVTIPERFRKEWTRSDAAKELLRGRLDALGPTTSTELASSLGLGDLDVEAALVALEVDGVVLRGSFTANAGKREWCERRLLARIHRYTLNRLRAEIEPVAPADFMRFLFAWQKIDPNHRATGPEGLAGIVTQLDGYECAAGAWERDVLPSRMDDYDPDMLDTLSLTGRVMWSRLSPPARSRGESGQAGPAGAGGPIRSTPIALFLREHAASWLALARPRDVVALGAQASQVLAALDRKGAVFFQELVDEAGLLATQVEQALAELVASGLVTSDSFAGLRALLTPSDRRKPLRAVGHKRRRTTAPFGIESAGRWSRIRAEAGDASGEQQDATEAQAWSLLRRYGVVFRRLLARETNLAPWRELTAVYRRLEARGEIRGGRFVSGMSGEQFALPEAVGQLRKVRREGPTGQLIGMSAADPLNLTGVITPGPRVGSIATNRVAYLDGVPVAAQDAGKVVVLGEYDPSMQRDVERALVRVRMPPKLRVYLGRAG
ncbi:MAG: DEAD/DEAH box helicase [Gemmatimonadales bacterium]|nr:DEAD/DEAH box helicase [Gemmatimonadales bacterium]